MVVRWEALIVVGELRCNCFVSVESLLWRV